MLVWIIQDGEPLPGIDSGTRDWRCGILARMLVAQGYEVFWWASTFDHTRKKHRFNAPRTVEILPGLKIRLLHGPGYSQNKSPKRWWHQRILARTFASEAAGSIRPGIIFSSLPLLELAEQAVLYGQRINTPVLVDIRDLWPDHYLTLVPPQLRGLLKVVLFSEFRRVRRILQGATGITAISQTFLNWGLNYAGRLPHKADGIFPMGYPSRSMPEANVIARRKELISHYGIRSDGLIVTFAGSLNSIFDFQTVIEAARFLDHVQMGVQFVIIGDGDGGVRVRARAKGLSNVIFTGWLDQTSVAAALGLASVGLTPYAEGRSISGSLPNKAFEYMSAGLPLLSSHRGDLEKIICDEQIGLQYKSGDANSLVEQIRRLAAHPDERLAMGRRARKLFENRFSADIIYPELVRHLEKTAGQ